MIKKLKNSLSTKVFLYIAGLLTLSSTVIYVILMLLLPKTYRVDLEGQINTDLVKLSEELNDATLEESVSYIDSFSLKNSAMVDITGYGSDYLNEHMSVAIIISSDQSVEFAISGNTDTNAEYYQDDETSYGNIDAENTEGLTDEELAELLGTDSFTYNLFALYTTETYTTTVTLKDSGGEPTILNVSAPLESVAEVSQIFIRLIPWILLIILAISLLGAFIITQILARPVVKISRVAKKMSALDMTWNCDVSRSDEIGVLSDSLNTMAHNLNEALTDLQNANEKLQADIEREQEQERQRRHFFRSVSHELKTPITILKAQLESMIYGLGVYKDRDKYLKESLKTTESMENLVKEILMVSKMETDDLNIDFAPVNISDLLDNCCQQYEPLAQDKAIELVKDLETPLTYSINKRLFKRALSNVLGNAIKYAPEGAKVLVSLKKEDGQYQLTIENTGSSIPQEDLDHLFTPFYRIDKSMNRNTGGSGLGLYIVKNALDLHGLKYGISSNESSVLFYITFTADNT